MQDRGAFSRRSTGVRDGTVYNPLMEVLKTEHLGPAVEPGGDLKLKGRHTAYKKTHRAHAGQLQSGGSTTTPGCGRLSRMEYQEKHKKKKLNGVEHLL